MRDLYNDILRFKGEEVFEYVLKLWVEGMDYRAYLEGLSTDHAANYPDEDSWELYALSRVLDTLTLRFQPNRNADGSAWRGPELSVAEYVEFIEMLGLKAIDSDAYEPFYHEIFEAVPGEVNFQITERLFPPVMLGNLLIKRGGVVIALDPQSFELETVNNSTIYWAYRRKNRKHQDLSHGWGSNSQWRTDFRLDYDLGDSYLYNAAGGIDLNAPSPEAVDELNEYGLSLREAVEITVNRHFITSKKPSEDLFPYGYRYLERKPN